MESPDDLTSSAVAVSLCSRRAFCEKARSRVRVGRSTAGASIERARPRPHVRCLRAGSTPSRGHGKKSPCALSHSRKRRLVTRIRRRTCFAVGRKEPRRGLLGPAPLPIGRDLLTLNRAAIWRHHCRVIACLWRRIHGSNDNSIVGDGRGHIRTWLIFLFFAILPCRGADSGLSISAVLYTNFRMEPPPAIMRAIQDELESIISPMGFQIEWRSISEGSRYTDAAKIAVVTFKGRCDVTANSPTFRRGGVLGLTHISNGVILPFSDVDCDEIRGFLQRDLWTRDPNTRPNVFGRAVARVLAHELYHVFAKTTRHGSCGLGKSAYSTADLLSERFQFEKVDAIALREGGSMDDRKSARKKF
jgi:hypothetical protein